MSRSISCPRLFEQCQGTVSGSQAVIVPENFCDCETVWAVECEGLAKHKTAFKVNCTRASLLAAFHWSDTYASLTQTVNILSEHFVCKHACALVRCSSHDALASQCTNESQQHISMTSERACQSHGCHHRRRFFAHEAHALPRGIEIPSNDHTLPHQERPKPRATCKSNI